MNLGGREGGKGDRGREGGREGGRMDAHAHVTGVSEASRAMPEVAEASEAHMQAFAHAALFCCVLFGQWLLQQVCGLLKL